jgi:hypothetical protein
MATRLDLAPTRSAPVTTGLIPRPVPRGVGPVKTRTRVGTCHRCGWRREISRVARAERRIPQVGFAYARLCGECRIELARQDALGVRGPDLPKQRWARPAV